MEDFIRGRPRRLACFAGELSDSVGCVASIVIL
jgi:hypothetical protein